MICENCNENVDIVYSDISNGKNKHLCEVCFAKEGGVISLKPFAVKSEDNRLLAVRNDCEFIPVKEVFDLIEQLRKDSFKSTGLTKKEEMAYRVACDDLYQELLIKLED